MDYFGINSTDDLPKISEVMMEELVQATIVAQSVVVDETVPTTAPEIIIEQAIEIEIDTTFTEIPNGETDGSFTANSEEVTVESKQEEKQGEDSGV